MPVHIQKITSGKNKGKYRVVHGGTTSAKATSKKKAKKQERLLNAVAHGWKPIGRKS